VLDASDEDELADELDDSPPDEDLSLLDPLLVLARDPWSVL
jgi:hypothetical protein